MPSSEREYGSCMVWVGIDDTDSPKGGCTTWVLSEVLRRVAREGDGIDLIGPPRLVRLNPNIPWKTRGNAALAARFGRGRGPSHRVGASRGVPLLAHDRADPLRPPQVDRLWEIVLDVVARASDRSEPGTDPTVVLAPGALPSELYWRAVREVVPWREVREELLKVKGLRFAAYGSGQGLVGATAAISWPGRRATWEAIAYRGPSRWGTPRHVDGESVRRVAERYEETFLSFDERTRRTLVAPHTPCPILFGLRALTPSRLPRAVEEIEAGEELDRWVLFRTNQATGDHLLPRPLSETSPGTSGVYQGVVARAPEPLPGGHVLLTLSDDGLSLGCVAFEPTKTLPRLARELLPGDQVRVWGSYPCERVGARRLRLEGMELLRARPLWLKRHNPRCPRCQKRMRSLGAGKGFRCGACGGRSPPESASGTWLPRSHLQGVYLPTPSARRHLAPLRAPRPRGRPAL
ncbi:MAG: DUF1743 domain-containing protein [Euryarchaeota archaeon]|nr:DUF1743 domain-containing protein [Euryarchaeota archaeon]MDE1834985.1 DUF1743 domain-containing protein [Euryarchaeota archaeon]MDE1880674.1 DUF1743 domain-containing protein [Euryarchaeota archaeon]MDE2044824.1 DUF1743 domain-containing protein [Thermoplasmata archaeon]